MRSTVLAVGARAAGTSADPGLMVRSLAEIFRERETAQRASGGGEEFTVTCSYLEVYNEARVAHTLECGGSCLWAGSVAAPTSQAGLCRPAAAACSPGSYYGVPPTGWHDVLSRTHAHAPRRR